MIRIDCLGLSEGPSDDGLSGSEQVRQAYDCLVRNGYAILDRLLPEDTVAALRCAVAADAGRLLNAAPRDEALEIGDRRNLFPLPFAGAFADPLVWGNPVIVALARMALADEAVLESYGIVVSLPGAERQHLHRDGPALFDSAISPLLPAHALTVALPLVDMNETNGTTALWPGSHRWQKADRDAPSVSPVVPPGSAILWDFRLYHAGTANRSPEPRPLITATFAQRWYQDPVNFEQGNRRRLALDEAFVAGVPAGRRRLFAHLGND
jgi:hypothetical protein